MLNWQKRASENRLLKGKMQEKYFSQPRKEGAGITEDVKFYINGNNRLVIVFEKYEISPGSSGEIEFEITGGN